MKKYIEKDKVVSVSYRYCHTVDGRCCGPDDVVELYEELKAIPAADVVEVVRCAECAHHVDCGYHYCNMWCVNCPDDADFFCAYGEKMDGGVNYE